MQSGSDDPRWSSPKGTLVEEETTGDARAKSAGCNRKSVTIPGRARQQSARENMMTKVKTSSGGDDPSEASEHAPQGRTHADAWASSWGRTVSEGGETTSSGVRCVRRARHAMKNVHVRCYHAARIHCDDQERKSTGASDQSPANVGDGDGDEGAA